VTDGGRTTEGTGRRAEQAERALEAKDSSLRGAMAEAMSEQFSLEKSIGGVRGLLESVVPITLFSVIYGITDDIRTSSIAALVSSVLFAIWRLAKREPLMQAVSGAIGIGIGAYLATRTGRSENFFATSILKNIAFAVAYLVSIVARWPLIGVALGFALGEGTGWRAVPERLRAYQRATWIWVGMFAIRVAVQVPLYLAAMAAALGFVNVVLGLPLFAATAYLTWLVIRRVPVARPGDPATSGPTGSGPTGSGPTGSDPAVSAPG
jgi:uncharacterized membrane protein